MAGLIKLTIFATILVFVTTFVGGFVLGMIYSEEVSGGVIFGDKIIEIVRASALASIVASAIAGFLLSFTQGNASKDTLVGAAFIGAVINVALGLLLFPPQFSNVGFLYRDDVETWDMVAKVGTVIATTVVAWLVSKSPSERQPEIH